MSDEPTSAVGPDKGEGRAEEGSSSPAPENAGEQENEPASDGDHPDEAQGTAEIPIGTPMTEEQWRQAKKRAERPDPGD